MSFIGYANYDAGAAGRLLLFSLLTSYFVADGAFVALTGSVYSTAMNAALGT